MINPMVANKELCDVVLSCYGLNPFLATRLIYESNMKSQNKDYWKPEKLQLLHDMKNDFRIHEKQNE